MSVSHPLLARRPLRPAPSITLSPAAPDLQLAQGRVHEGCGPARRTFALWCAARLTGPVFWIAPPWTRDRLNGEGIASWIEPARLVFVSPKRGEDLLWCMEEVLRSGVAALSVVDLEQLPGLTQVRRMHLAAETGGQSGPTPPMGMLLTPSQGGAAGVETRWHIRARHDKGQDIWTLERLRARTAPRKSWDICRPDPEQPPRIKTA